MKNKDSSKLNRPKSSKKNKRGKNKMHRRKHLRKMTMKGGGGLSPSVGDSLKGATVGRAGLLPLGKGKKNKGTWRKNRAFTSRSRGN